MMGSCDIVCQKRGDNTAWKISVAFFSDLVLAAQKCNLNSYIKT